MGIPWRAAEAMHWALGEQEMAQRAGVSLFTLTSTATQPSTTPALASTTLGPQNSALGPIYHGPPLPRPQPMSMPMPMNQSPSQRSRGLVGIPPLAPLGAPMAERRLSVHGSAPPNVFATSEAERHLGERSSASHIGQASSYPYQSQHHPTIHSAGHPRSQQQQYPDVQRSSYQQRAPPTGTSPTQQYPENNQWPSWQQQPQQRSDHQWPPSHQQRRPPTTNTSPVQSSGAYISPFSRQQTLSEVPPKGRGEGRRGDESRHAGELGDWLLVEGRGGTPATSLQR